LDHPRIIDEDIDPAEMPENGLYHGLHPVSIGDVAWRGVHRPSVPTEVVTGAFQLLCVAGANRHVGTLAQ
jgi:hypothetical protein